MYMYVGLCVCYHIISVGIKVIYMCMSVLLSKKASHYLRHLFKRHRLSSSAIEVVQPSARYEETLVKRFNEDR